MQKGEVVMLDDPGLLEKIGGGIAALFLIIGAFSSKVRGWWKRNPELERLEAISALIKLNNEQSTSQYNRVAGKLDEVTDELHKVSMSQSVANERMNGIVARVTRLEDYRSSAR